MHFYTIGHSTRSLEEFIEKIDLENSPSKRLMLIRESVKNDPEARVLNRNFFAETIMKLKSFTDLLDSTGSGSVDRNLMAIYGSDEDFRRFYALLKCFLHCTEDVGKSIIATVFEEFFCGATLFKEVYGIRAIYC